MLTWAQRLAGLAGTAGRALAPTVEALPLMVCRSRRRLDIALAELAFELGEEVLHVRNEAPQHLDDQPVLPPKRPTISPRASTSSPASAAVAGAPLAPLLPR